jgi:monoamine oxidase
VPAVHKFFDDVAATFPFPYEVLTNRSLVEKLDQLSVEDRLNERFASDPVARDFADNWASVPLARQCSEVSLAATMALTSAFGGVEASLEGTGFRLKEGTSSLINNIVEDGGFDYRLGAPVASISQNNSGATVVLRGGETLSAEKVILTTPVNTYDGIEFNPPLNAAKQIVSKGKMAGGHGSHINAKLKGKSPPILAVAPSDMPLGLLLTTDVFEDSTIVDGYGPDADLFDGSDPEEVQEVIRQWIPDAEVLETVSYRWDLDPYSQGTWAGYKPGVLSKYFEGLRESEGHVYFASGDSATAFRGFMEGAIESGVRVSRDVHRSLAGIKET